MNKRIQELADQAGLQPYYDAQKEQIAKFAELIVRECMNVCQEQRNPQNLNYKPSERFAEHLRFHFFGVE